MAEPENEGRSILLDPTGYLSISNLNLPKKTAPLSAILKLPGFNLPSLFGLPAFERLQHSELHPSSCHSGFPRCGRASGAARYSVPPIGCPRTQNHDEQRSNTRPAQRRHCTAPCA